MLSLFTVAAILATAITVNTQTINLRAAATFGVFAGASITNTGVTEVIGSIGLFPGVGIVGFPPGIFTGMRSGGTVLGNAVDFAVHEDASTAYNQAITTSCDTDLTGQDLGGQVLTPGIYCFDTSASLSGVLTLDGLGQVNPLFVFQIGTSLTTATASEILLTNGLDLAISISLWEAQ
jgi:hypothetical protein